MIINSGQQSILQDLESEYKCNIGYEKDFNIIIEQVNKQNHSIDSFIR